MKEVLGIAVTGEWNWLTQTILLYIWIYKYIFLYKCKTGYTLKFVIAGLITPLLYFTRNILHDKFGLEPLPLDYKEEGDNNTGNPAQSMAVG